MKLSASSSFLFSNLFEQTTGIIKSLGIVFGDIGTSPLYTLSAIFEAIPHSETNIIGVVSLIFWTLIMLVTVQYAWLAMSLSIRGEGGTIVLCEILKSLLKSKRAIALVTIISFVGTSLFIGDGVITPAITIMSAVEGIDKVPGIPAISQSMIVLMSCIIAVLLFSLQRGGVERVSRAFGPIMALWFVVLSISGIVSLGMYGIWILKALNPYYAFRCLFDNGVMGFFILSGVILCATGGEALYADMGHLGRRPIRQAWFFVFIALALNYAGQGAFLLANTTSRAVFFDMIAQQASLISSYLYIPLLLLATIAAVIASQALISGVFSVVYQGITTQLLPMLRIQYTSSRLHAQVYIGVVNWLLMIAVLVVMFYFERSTNLAYAYGLAVSGVMLLTSILMTWIFKLRHATMKMILGYCLVPITLTYCFSCLLKLQMGAYWSLIIAAVPFSVILVYYLGQRRMRTSHCAIDQQLFVDRYTELYNQASKLKGTAIFFVRDPKAIPPYLTHAMFDNGIIYEENILVSIATTDDPYGIKGFYKDDLGPGLRVFEIQCGYLEVPNIDRILRQAGISSQAIFYGLDIIVTKNVFWRIYALIKHLSPTFVQFHKLPYAKLHGVVTLVEM